MRDKDLNAPHKKDELMKFVENREERAVLSRSSYFEQAQAAF